jgi:hypothetical protein
VVAHFYNPNYSGDKGRFKFKDSLGKKLVRPYLKKAGERAQITEHLPSMCEALGLISSTTHTQTNE